MKASTTNTFNLYPGHLTYEQLNGCGSAGCLADPVAGAVRYNANNRTAILDPTNPLLTNTEYPAVIEGEGDGTPMVRDRFFYFATSSGGPGGF